MRSLITLAGVTNAQRLGWGFIFSKKYVIIKGRLFFGGAKMQKPLTPLAKQKEKYLFVFLASFIILAIIYIPILIYNKGILLYYGDFNSQQLMFYEHAHDYVREFGFGWDWGTDLGSDIIGAYAFYLYGSPFFWLTIPFPSGAVVYLIPWLLCLKTAVAALTSYAFLRRFVKSPNAAAIGAMLYAFSSAQIYNMFFNHFHDVSAFFPLVLLALEMRVQDNRRGVFALAVGLLATVNYYFFASIVAFTLLYFFIRCASKDFRLTLGKFISLAIEAVIGVLFSAVVFLPAALSVLSNPRLSQSLSGIDMVAYSDPYRLHRIAQSLFMFPDMPARSNLFASDTARWASIAAYLPMFSMVGVIAFFRGRGKHWAKRLSVFCAVAACVPILNSAFQLFNGSYYARWYFMPVLIMALMTAIAVDDKAISLKKGIPAVAAVLATFAVIFLLPKTDSKTGETTFGKVAQYPDLAVIQIVGTILLFAVLVFIVYFVPNKKTALKRLVPATVATVFVGSAALIWYAIAQGPYQDYYIDHAINGEIDLPKQEGEFYRIDTSENVDNWCMFWGYSSMRCFQSTASPSIMSFYEDTMNITRNVATRVEPRYYALRQLLSVKYYLKQVSDEDTEIPVCPVDGFEYIDTQNDFYIYENEYYVPMGFAFDKYVRLEDTEKLTTAQTSTLAMNAIFLTDDQIERYEGLIESYGDSLSASRDSVFKSAKDKATKSCYYFKERSDGFDAKIKLEKPSLVFFSVPFDKGFTAYVNGERVKIENVYDGLMAIAVPAGDSEITFEYETVGLKAGLAITIGGILLFMIYMAVTSKLAKKNGVKVIDGREYDYESVDDMTDEEAEKYFCAEDFYELEDNKEQAEEEK